MKTDFSDWLIVSDVDGTLKDKTRRLPRKNVLAIERFVQAGGHFTLASGRPVSSLRRNYDRVPCNAPAVVLNGAGLYDFDRNRMLTRRPIGAFGQAFVARVHAQFPQMEIGVFFDDYIYLGSSGVLSVGQLLFERMGFEPCRLQDIPKGQWCKVVFWGAPPLINRLIRFAQETVKNGELNFMKTSPVSFEMLEGGVHKGVGVMELAAQLGIAKDHVAAIGDYYNDWDMLKAVGLPACAGQAPRELHALCRFEACHCNHGAVADLIAYIMRLEERTSSV